MAKCPRCGSEVSELIPVDPAIQAQMQASGASVPPAVCVTCQSDLRQSARPSGGVLAVQERAKEQHRMHLWKSRVQMIRRARLMMSQKHYAEAAVAYEKYLKVLEMVFGCKKGQQITPEMFKDNARTSELTVVTSVYWDLLRIYDTGDTYQQRQEIAAKQLAKFVRFTPIFPDILKKAQLFVKQARKPAVIKSFIKAASEQNPRCFIATSAFESEQAPEVKFLRQYRDLRLMMSPAGRASIEFYYCVSPKIASLMDKNPRLKAPVRKALRAMIRQLEDAPDLTLEDLKPAPVDKPPRKNKAQN